MQKRSVNEKRSLIRPPVASAKTSWIYFTYGRPMILVRVFATYIQIVRENLNAR